MKVQRSTGQKSKGQQDGHEVVKSGRYLRLVIRDGWEYIERVNCSGVVIIVSKTDDNKVVLIEQFRHPVQKKVIAFPAGLAGDEHGKRGEPLSAAAKRELLEETGYKARTMKKIFVGPVSAGMCRDMVTIFRASGIRKVAKGGGVGEWEEIKVHEVPLDSVDAWLKRRQRKGFLVAPNVYAGIYFLKNWI